MTYLTVTALQTIPHWHDTIQWGDIVSFRLSHHDNDAQLPPERPWLVVDLNTYVGERYVTLARGYDVGALPHRSHEVLVADRDVMQAAGLAKPILFNCKQQIVVSVNHKHFDLGEASSPIIGRVTGEQRHHLNTVRARIAAFADMARERRDAHLRNSPGLMFPAPYSLDEQIG